MNLSWMWMAIGCIGASEGPTGVDSAGRDTGVPSGGDTALPETSDTGTEPPGSGGGNATYTITATNQLDGMSLTRSGSIVFDDSSVGVTYEEGATDAIVQLTLGATAGPVTDSETVAIVASLDFAGTDRSVPVAGRAFTMQPVLVSSRTTADFVALANGAPAVILEVDELPVSTGTVTLSNFDGNLEPVLASCFSDAGVTCNTWAGLIDVEAAVEGADDAGRAVELAISGRTVVGWQQPL